MFLLLVGLFLSNDSWAADRGPPRGADNIRAVASIYAAPGGEVQFLEARGDKAEALFRRPNGELLPLVRTDGPRDCDGFAHARVAGCRFAFQNGADVLEVRGEELEPSLFNSVSRGIQSRSSDVTL